MKAINLEHIFFIKLAFDRHFKVLATEVPIECGIADLLGYKNNLFYEYEVKRSMQDLYCDVKKNRGHKHPHYCDIMPDDEFTKPYYNKKFRPNYFYYVITKDIQDRAIKYVTENYPKYGVIVYDASIVRGAAGQFKTARRAKRLCGEHTLEMKLSIIEIISGRCRSELGNFYIEHVNHMREICNNSGTRLINDTEMIKT